MFFRDSIQIQEAKIGVSPIIKKCIIIAAFSAIFLGPPLIGRNTVLCFCNRTRFGSRFGVVGSWLDNYHLVSYSPAVTISFPRTDV